MEHGKHPIVEVSSLKFSYEAVKAIKDWHRGRKSGSECAKIVVKDAIATISGVAAGMGARALGAPGILAGSAGATGAYELSEWLEERIFRHHKEKALKQAYEYFGLTSDDSFEDVKIQYEKRQAELDHESGDLHKEFLELHSNFHIIEHEQDESESSSPSSSEVSSARSLSSSSSSSSCECCVII